MSCEKYSGWMTDAALGELRAEREPELLAHAMECEACREALNHARNVRAFVERGVESVVAGEPATGFEMRLRRRMALEARLVESGWKAWAPLAAGAAAVFAVVLIVITGHLARHSDGNASVASSATAVARAVASSSTPVESVAPATEVRAPGRALSTARTLRGRSVSAATVEIIVPAGQLVAAARLSEAINSGRVDGTQLVEAQRDADKPLEVNPIEITPLEPPPTPDDEVKPAAPTEF